MTTARFSVPLLQVGQAQKEVTHNEAVQALENIVQPVVVGPPTNTPPTAAAVGSQYLVGDDPQEAFAEHPRALASWTEAGWLFTDPRPLLTVTDESSGLTWTFEGDAWRSGVVRASEVQVGGQKVLGARSPAIASPVGGTVIDQEVRVAVAALLSSLRQHGLIAS